MLLSIFSRFAFYSYWGMALVASIGVAVIVAMVSKSAHRKFFGVLAGVLVMIGFITPIALRINADKKVVEAKQDRYATAKAIFDERCKSAGEKIYKTVDNVEGVTLLKVRPRVRTSDYNPQRDPMWADAALFHEGLEEVYIKNFMGWSLHDIDSPINKINPHIVSTNSEVPISQVNKQKKIKGYPIVDVRQADGNYLRYQANDNNDVSKPKQSLTTMPQRYAIDFINYIDPNDRKYWVAGTKVIILDTKTNETIAEKTWFALERGQGSTSPDREPWVQGGITCPEDGWYESPTRYFVEKVLKPKQ